MDEDRKGVADAADPKIFAIVDCRRNSAGLSHSLSSASAAGLTPVVLGEPPIDCEGPTVRKPDELSRFASASGSVLLLAMQAGDRVAPCAGQRYSEAFGQAERLVYADDDIIDAAGNRSYPHFKPGWNAELFRHHDYITGACVVRASSAELASLPEQGWAESLTRLIIDVGVVPSHVATILHHRRRRPLPKVPAAPTLASTGELPPVSLIIPTRNQEALLQACIAGVRRTDYLKKELIIVDNGSDEESALGLLRDLERSGAQVLRRPGPFNFSTLNNAAAKLATGKLLCLLNNDIEVMKPDWLEILAAQAIRSDVGAVGARLLYPDHTVQHAGVVIGLGGGAGHAHRFQESDAPGYFERARLPQFVSAVTAACLVVDREKYWSVGGLDEQAFPVAFNDVDFCLRLNARGWQSLYEPRATLIHHESKSRGKDSDPANRQRFAQELANLKERWGTENASDPFHNPNLSRLSERFVVAL